MQLEAIQFYKSLDLSNNNTFIKHAFKEYMWCERQARRNGIGEKMDKCQNLRTAIWGQTRDVFSLVLCHPMVALHGCRVEQVRTSQVCNSHLPWLFFHVQQIVAWTWCLALVTFDVVFYVFIHFLSEIAHFFSIHTNQWQGVTEVKYVVSRICCCCWSFLLFKRTTCCFSVPCFLCCRVNN